jgi:hypothetical protein
MILEKFSGGSLVVVDRRLRCCFKTLLDSRQLGPVPYSSTACEGNTAFDISHTPV